MLCALTYLCVKSKMSSFTSRALHCLESLCEIFPVRCSKRRVALRVPHGATITVSQRPGKTW